MKRPLCIVSLTFVLTVMILLKIFPIPAFSFSFAKGQEITVVGQVYEKETKNETSHIYIKNVVITTDYPKTNEIYQQSIENKVENFSVICMMKQSENIKLGSIVCVNGKYKPFESATNPGDFDSARYYQIKNIGFSLSNAALLEQSEDYFKCRELLYEVRQYCESILDSIYEKTDASIIKAMVLGNKTELDSDLKALYQRNGIAHILAISGLHISFIGMSMYKLFRKISIPIWLSAICCMSVMLLYGIMTGMSTSTYRALTMFLLHLIADIIGRSYDMLTALALVCVLMLIEQPLYIYHSGFLLSFGAVMGIGLIYPLLSGIVYRSTYNKAEAGIRSYMQNSTIMHKILDSFLSSCSVSLFTLPVLLYYYYEFPVYSLILNLLVIPLMAFLLLFGIGSILLGSIYLPLAILISYPAKIILGIYEAACLLLEKMPYANAVLGVPKLWQIIGYYLVFAMMIIFALKISNAVKCVYMLIAISVLTMRFSIGLHVTMIDVGQGDAFFIRSESGTTYMIDGGSSSEKKLAQYTLIPFLKYHGVSQVDYVFVSHPDADHVSGIIDILSNNTSGIRIGHLIMPRRINKDEAYIELEKEAEKAGTALLYMVSGDCLRDGSLSFTALHPQEDFVTDDANAYSLVLSMSYYEFDVLFTGDVEGSGETEMLRQLKKEKENGTLKNYELLKTAHHGSKNSTPNELLDLINAKYAWISCGKNNTYGHPHKELLERLENENIEICITYETGAVTLQINKNGDVHLRTFR